MSQFKYKIDYRGQSKIIKRIVDRLNNVGILGISHDEAYYGDWGNDAYLHSLLREGNPHKVTLEDLGIELLPRQVQMLLEATGGAYFWGNHEMEDGEDVRIVDHEGDYILLHTADGLLAWH